MSKFKTKILIVEDDKALAEMLANILQEKKHEVILAGTGKEALKKVRENPDLVLLDIMLPDTSGVEVLKKIKAADETSSIPVVILTNVAKQDVVSEIFAAGGKEYIVKSDWKINDVVKKIEKYLK